MEATARCRTQSCPRILERDVVRDRDADRPGCPAVDRQLLTGSARYSWRRSQPAVSSRCDILCIARTRERRRAAGL